MVQKCSLCFIWWTLTSQETDFVKHFENKKEIKEDVQYSENNIYASYQNISPKIPVQKTNMKENVKRLQSDIIKQGEALQKK